VTISFATYRAKKGDTARNSVALLEKYFTEPSDTVSSKKQDKKIRTMRALPIGDCMIIVSVDPDGQGVATHRI
jgi:hypothetical protein